MKYASWLSAFVILTGCGSASDTDSIVGQLWTRLTGPTEEAAAPISLAMLRAAFTPEVMAQVDGPILLLERSATGATAALSRNGVNTGVETFLTTENISISLQDGLIVATRGFGFDLMTADVAETVVALNGQTQRGVRVHRYLDGENQIVAQSFICSYQTTSAQTYAETCQSSSDEFENTYTLDSKGNIVRSIQWVSSVVGYLELERIE